MAHTLLLMRHGRIEANAKGLWHGSTDSPLLPRGKRQARRAGAHLANQTTHISAIYTSPLERCRDTAQYAADALNRRAAKAQRRSQWRNRWHRVSGGLLGSADSASPTNVLEPEVVDDLREYAIGDWEGMPFAELNAKHQFIERAARDHDYAPPGGESLREVSTRGSEALATIDQRHDETEIVLVVAHGALLGIALATMLNKDPSMWMDYHIDNCSLSELDLQEYPERMPALRRFNMIGHL